MATLFPELFPGPLAASLAGEALRQGLWALETVALRDFGIGRHRAVDDAPAGGGAGMVLRADVVAAAIDAAGGAPDLPGSAYPAGRAVHPGGGAGAGRRCLASSCWPAASKGIDGA